MRTGGLRLPGKSYMTDIFREVDEELRRDRLEKLWKRYGVLIVVAVTRSRYGRKDKRPLDPPPVVQVKCYQIARQGSAEQGGREFDTYE